MILKKQKLMPLNSSAAVASSSTGVLSPFVRALWLISVLLITMAAFFFTAWLCEDAYIDFRVVDNIVAGAGPVWNVGERVQVYTSPLWVGLLALLVRVFDAQVTHMAFALSLCCDCLVAMIAVSIAARHPFILGAVFLWLMGSQSFLDYSSSGLENPLMHAVLAVICLILCQSRTRSSGILWTLTSLACSIAALVRLDAASLVWPTWLYVGLGCYRQLGLRETVKRGTIGLLPLIAWELFSVFYYGSLLPNTVLAKSPLGYPIRDLISKGLTLISATAVHDPGTLLAIVGVPVILFLIRSRLALVSLGASVSSLLATIFVGGDFMQGRFLSAPFVFSCLILLVGISEHDGSVPVWRAVSRQVVLVICLISAGSAFSAFRQVHDGKFGMNYGPRPLYRGQVADERSFYNQFASLRALWIGRYPPWVIEGTLFRAGLGARKAIVAKRNVGMFSYAAGNDVFVVDLLSLGNPFLARLPACPSDRAGHFFRPLPAGYAWTLVKGSNRVKDPLLAQLLDDVLLATRAPLTQRSRMRAIWRLSNGTYRDVQQMTNYTRVPKGVANLDVASNDRYLACPNSTFGGRTDIMAIAGAEETHPPWLNLRAR